MATADLFEADGTDASLPGGVEPIGPQSCVLRGLARPMAPALLAAVQAVVAQAPWRRMVTPGGRTMSVAQTNCGAWGWTSDRSGYRYTRHDPATGLPWPPLPESFSHLAAEAAASAGFTHFAPDACLINRYGPGHRLSLHQDKDERDLAAPIVSVSLGLPAVFQFGGRQRSERPARAPLWHGDVVVWGGVDRLRFHGVLPLKDGHHPQLGAARINLTFRRAG